MKNELLKPCPFCGGKAYLNICDSEAGQYPTSVDEDTVSFLAVDEDPNFEGCWVFCEDCNAGTNTYDSPEQAIAAWNERTK